MREGTIISCDMNRCKYNASGQCTAKNISLDNSDLLTQRTVEDGILMCVKFEKKGE